MAFKGPFLRTFSCLINIQGLENSSEPVRVEKKPVLIKQLREKGRS